MTLNKQMFHGDKCSEKIKDKDGKGILKVMKTLFNEEAFVQMLVGIRSCLFQETECPWFRSMTYLLKLD